MPKSGVAGEEVPLLPLPQLTRSKAKAGAIHRKLGTTVLDGIRRSMVTTDGVLRKL